MDKTDHPDKREDITGMQQGITEFEAGFVESVIVDHQTVDWQQVQRCRYLIHQRFSYEYPSPIYDLDQRLMILPPEHYGKQQRRLYRFEVSLPTDLNSVELDAFGNTKINLFVPVV